MDIKVDHNIISKRLYYPCLATKGSSPHTLGSEKWQLMIQMQRERVKQNKIMEQVYVVEATADQIEEKHEQENALLIASTTTPLEI